ncbi:MBL fold metallo-hydrolase [Piscinibacter koreensis]|uniref:MBL fold metallo-hydrolase n=1 Tax=Piscinibacter koreensis TaxID=2742824 RepID=A0A7Y6TXP3_9BURK|nr:MBL fold metallo-hydrolase [Schlegelella koreensis]NUZ07339.1 MBL fold metallo-hydrolase [Schlegelella koreensis]
MRRVLSCVAILLSSACATGVGADACEARFKSSPQFASDECGFRNPPNPDAKPALSGWRNWTRFLFETKVGTVPVDPIPVRRLDRAALDALDPAANHIVRLGHSSHLLKLQGRYWLIDPVFGERASPVSFAGPKRFHAPPLALAEVPRIEGLVLSHDHYDHLDAGTIEALRDRVQRYFVPLGVGARLREWGVPADRIEELDWWQQREWAGVVVTAAPAQHFSGRTLWDRNRTLWAAWSLASGAERIFYSGDTGYFPGFREIGTRLGRIDLALMENGAYDAGWPSVHMTPEETVQAFEELGARTLFLVHNSTFDLAFHGWREPLERVAALAERKGIALATPEIGEVLTLGRPRENRRWWEGLR